MKEGISRKFDELGRITLPIEIRRYLKLEEKDSLDIIVQDGCIILTPEDKCVFCGSREDLISYKGKHACHKCYGEIGDLKVR